MKQKKRIMIINLLAFINSLLLITVLIIISIFISKGFDRESDVIVGLSVPAGLFIIGSITIGFCQIFTFSYSHMSFLQLWAGWLNVFFILIIFSAICSFIVYITVFNSNEHYKMVEKYHKFEQVENAKKRARWNEELLKMEQEELKTQENSKINNNKEKTVDSNDKTNKKNNKKNENE